MKILLIPMMMSLTLTLAEDAALQEFTDGNNLFAASVYKEVLQNSKDNFLVSPFSTETVLALAQSGAKDETAKEIRTSLHLPDDQEKIETAIKSLQPALRNNELYSLQTANKIYVKKDFPINDDFKKTATDVFGADSENIDFAKNEEAAEAMNAWVEKQTNDKIKNLIDSASLTDRTRAILINALYFKGNWSNPFEIYATAKQNFHKTENDVIQADTMQDSGRYNYYESNELNAKFLRLNFEGEDVSMTVVLPNEKSGLQALENQIDQVFRAPDFAVEYVRVALPKFKIETKLDFKEILENLGVSKVFKDEEADLSGIAGDKGDLIIDKVIQKTFIDVTEQGVEAAAASYVEVGVPLSGYFPSEPPKEFIADHPFIFYIQVKDLIIFAGRVLTPSQ